MEIHGSLHGALFLQTIGDQFIGNVMEELSILSEPLEAPRTEALQPVTSRWTLLELHRDIQKPGKL